MASVNGKEPVGEMILKDALGSDDVIAKTPTVLSCGGIYIPRSKKEQRIIYHIITTSSREEPVKVLSGFKPRNELYEILIKESLN